MPPGNETRELIANVEERARSAMEQRQREAELEREAQRQKDLRALLWMAILGALAILGTVAAFWDDLVRNELRLERLEETKPEKPRPERGLLRRWLR